VTYVAEWRIDHYDNQGHEGTILPGDVQWMTAGRGLIHNEIPAERVSVHSLQLWGNLPAADKMTGPRYQDLADDAVPVGRQPGVVVRVFFGASVPQANVVRQVALFDPQNLDDWGVGRTDNRAVVTLLLCLRIARHSSTPLSRACLSEP
jgi:redox-sensitive bicupin YhaK (pirin superfamily)